MGSGHRPSSLQSAALSSDTCSAAQTLVLPHCPAWSRPAQPEDPGLLDAWQAVLLLLELEVPLPDSVVLVPSSRSRRKHPRVPRALVTVAESPSGSGCSQGAPHA